MSESNELQIDNLFRIGKFTAKGATLKVFGDRCGWVTFESGDIFFNEDIPPIFDIGVVNERTIARKGVRSISIDATIKSMSVDEEFDMWINSSNAPYGELTIPGVAVVASDFFVVAIDLGEHESKPIIQIKSGGNIAIMDPIGGSTESPEVATADDPLTITRRDRFAMAALTSILASPDVVPDFDGNYIFDYPIIPG